ncbi:MarR family transcriptional regulator [Bryobacterales bacterium F-183]|nr:MarR family transcriptional regulator [Bryobacterales bacterium F-183]
MAGKLLEELKQTKPFESLETEAYLNVVKTADVLHQRAATVLKESSLSETQYNVLRILRGAGAAGLKCSEVGERMVTRDPDITRLLDRLEKQQLIERHRSQTDRRVVTTRITAAGLRLIDDLDAPLKNALHAMFASLSPAQLRDLIHALEAIRS